MSRSLYSILLVLLIGILAINAQSFGDEIEIIDLDDHVMSDDTDVYEISGAGDYTGGVDANAALYAPQQQYMGLQQGLEMPALTAPALHKQLPVRQVLGAAKTLNAIQATPIINKQYQDTTVTKAPIVHRQKVVRQVLMEQPIVRLHHLTQPVIRQIITQPIVRPHIYQTKKTQQYLVDQPVVKPRYIDQNVVHQQLIDQPVMAKARQLQPTYQLTKGATIPARLTSKKGQQYFGAFGGQQQYMADPQQQYMGDANGGEESGNEQMMMNEQYGAQQQMQQGAF